MKNIFLFSLLIFILASCGDVDEVKYIGINNVSGFNHDDGKYSAIVDVTLENPNRMNFVVKPSALDVYLGEKKLGNLILNKKIKLLKNSENKYAIDVSFQPNKLSLFDMAGIAMSGKKTTLRFVGDVRVGNGFIGKKFHVDKRKNIDLSELQDIIKNKIGTIGGGE